MRGFGWIGALVALLLIVGAGAVGYNLGLAANIAASGTAATVAHPAMWGWGWGFGFPFFGFIFFFLILFLIFGAFRRGRHGYYGKGPRYWNGGPEDWHRQMHERMGSDPTARDER
jgi:hypothetical protein